MIRTAEHEARSAKYAHIERERRWLVGDLPATVGPHVLIEDRYIVGTRLRLRRMTASADGTCALKLTKKYEAADPLARAIVTTYLTEVEYTLLAALPAHLLAKRRYPVDDRGQTFSVDMFLGPLTGLVLAEIESPDDMALRALASPVWAMREVSHDPDYQGAALAARCAGVRG